MVELKLINSPREHCDNVVFQNILIAYVTEGFNLITHLCRNVQRGEKIEKNCKEIVNKDFGKALGN